MGSKVPVIVPDNSACREQAGPNEERAIAVECATGLYATHNVVQKIIDHKKLAEAMKSVYDNPESAKDRVVTAYLWTQDHNWSDLGRTMTGLVSGFLDKTRNSLSPSIIERA